MSVEPRTLDPNDWNQVCMAAESFERALKHSPSVELDQFLPPTGQSLRSFILHELIKAELAFRWENGRGLLLEHYLEKFPELGAARALPAELIYAEYRARHRHGDRPPLSTYQARFPAQLPDLERMVRAETVTGPATHAESAAPRPAAQGSQLVTGGTELHFGGGYTLIERIGSGTFGEVWRAQSHGGGFQVAIKIIFRSIEHLDVQRELQSLEAIRGLRHVYLLTTQSFWFFADRLYIVMALAEGSLRERARQCKKQGLTGIPVDELLRYTQEASEALDYFHGKSVMHRDIKPENILLLANHVQLADFGLARVLERVRDNHATMSGTPSYMAPEVWQNQLSPHSDQYSLAATFAELRLGHEPFHGSSLIEIMRQHVEGDPDLAGMEQAEQQVVRKALAKDPDRRYPSCQDFAQALRKALATGRELPVPPSPGRRHLSLAAAVGVAVAAMVGWFGIAPLFRPSPAIAFDTLAPLRVRAGDQVPVFIGLHRVNYPSAIHLKWKAPPGIHLQPGDLFIADEAGGVQVHVAASETARPGKVSLTLEAPGTSTTLEVTILPLGTMPAHCGWVEGAAIVPARNGLKYYQQINGYLSDGTPVPFVVVPQERDIDPPTFYIMRDKVSNGLYGKFAFWSGTVSAAASLANPLGGDALLPTYHVVAAATMGSQWRLGAQVDEPMTRGRPMRKNLGADDPELPVFRVSALEAHQFARWLGGRLPSKQEWQRAAGVGVAGREGPYLGSWKQWKEDPEARARIGVGRKDQGPMRLDADTLDISPFGCHHMSGNGTEWTDTLMEPAEQTVSGCAERGFPERSDVFLCGRSYRDSRPLYFRDMDLNDRARSPFEPSPEIGFRVVIHP